MNKQKVLFISHDSNRTGAPVVLLNFLRWLKSNGDINFEILLLKEGPLKKDFEEVAKTYTLEKDHKYNLINKIRRRLHPELLEKYKIEEVYTKLDKNKYDLIYGNSIVSLPWLIKFKSTGNYKCICAIHELSYVIEHYFKTEYVVLELNKVDAIIAGSYAVEKSLLENFKILAEKVQVIHAFVDINFKIIKSKETLREELKIEKNELIIGCLATADLRKGIDLIAPLALLLQNKYPAIEFKIVWVGGTKTDETIKLFKQDIMKCGVEKKVIFLENTHTPDDYINLFDIFLLLSREDPFPLVVLSAANQQKAIIAFEHGGGAPELLSEGAGFIAPFLNIEIVAGIISTLYYDRVLLANTGKKAKEKFVERFSSAVIPKKTYNFLKTFN